MKFSLIAIVFAVAGLGWTGAATVRWFWLYPDMSQWIGSLFIGAGLLYVAYDQHWKRNNADRIDTQEHRIDLITEQVFHIKPKDKLS